MEESKPEFKVGDVVKLKSGEGPKMVVFEASNYHVKTVYFHKPTFSFKRDGSFESFLVIKVGPDRQAIRLFLYI